MATRRSRHVFRKGLITSGTPLKSMATTTTLDGEPQKAEGALKIYRLKQPEQVQRPDILGVRPVRVVRSRGRATVAKPQAPGPAADLSNPNTWELGEMVAEQGLTTDATPAATWTTKLMAGRHTRQFETQDRFRQEGHRLAAAERRAPEAKKFPIKVPNQVVGPVDDRAGR